MTDYEYQRPAPVRAVVIHPALKRTRKPASRGPEARLAEALGLARAIHLDIVSAQVIAVSKVTPGTFLGKGAVEALARTVKAEEADLVVADCHLSPIQQRNLEKALDCKVIDRTALILEIFGERARTREGGLQVELAHLTYQRSRLVRSWTHLERQRGALGFVGGPGETQIELDRRLISERITKLKKELDEVKRTRDLHRKARQRVPYPVIALVGYTNAGKSTLFNQLTRATVMAEDQLFATLDPTMRQVKLPSGRMVILSDTVGFISDLPHELVAAFRATLEEVLEADLVAHVRDISHPDSAAQKTDVETVLRELGLKDILEQNMVEILNKTDLLDAEALREVTNAAARDDRLTPLSALTGEGRETALALFDRLLSAWREEVAVTVPLEDGATIAWLHEHAEILDKREEEGAFHLRVRLDPADLGRLKSRLPEAMIDQMRCIPK